MALDGLNERAAALLRGAIDVHVHAAPDPYAERRMDALQLVRAAHEAGMAGLVLKSHEYPTQPLAWLLDAEFDDLTVYGALALDHAVGGLNPDAVEVSLRIGAKVIWMPTFDSRHWRGYRPQQVHSSAPGITVLDGGELLPVCHTILDLIAEHDGVAATGHLSTEETLALTAAARERSIRTVVTHASMWIATEAQQRLAALGAYIEQCATVTLGRDGDAVPSGIVEQIRAVGPEHVVLSTDLGQAHNPDPPLGFGQWIEAMLEAGFDDEEVGRMVRENPAALLG